MCAWRDADRLIWCISTCMSCYLAHLSWTKNLTVHGGLHAFLLCMDVNLVLLDLFSLALFFFSLMLSLKTLQTHIQKQTPKTLASTHQNPTFLFSSAAIVTNFLYPKGRKMKTPEMSYPPILNFLTSLLNSF